MVIEGRGTHILTSVEALAYSIIRGVMSEGGGPPGNKHLAKAIGVSRKEAGRIRKSVCKKLNLPSGF